MHAALRGTMRRLVAPSHVMSSSFPPSPARRRLLRTLCTASLALPFAPRAWAATPRSLAFYHTHTDETLSAVYFDDGRYVPDALDALNQLLRDFRSGEVAAIDPQLFDLLYALNHTCGSGTFEIISGFRSPQTNALLRRRSTGVAEGSLHLQGRAIDIRLRGRDTRRLRDAAVALRQGGVGYYRNSNFVHVDTGRVRTW